MPNPTSVSIVGLGTATPPFELLQDDAAEIAVRLCGRDDRERLLVRAIYRKAGVSTRRVVLLQPGPDGRPTQQFFDVEAGPESHGPSTRARMERFAREAPVLACVAGQRALDAAGLDAGAITHLVTVSCSGFSAPGFDIAMVRELRLPRTVRRVHVGYMGCHGAMNGLQVAAALARSEPGAVVLLCCVELCSLHFQSGWHPERVVANALFSDGAAAAVVRAGDSGRVSIVDFASTLVPGTEREMSWKIGDHGFEMGLTAKVPDLIAKTLGPWLRGWLAERGEGTIAHWIAHPGGPRILTAVEEGLGLGPGALDASRGVLRELGNMSSPTVLFVLERVLAAGARGRALMVAFGPGLAAEVGLLELR